MNKHLLVFDIGASNTRVAVSKDGDRLGPIEKFPTPKKYREGLSMLKQFAVAQGKMQRAAGGFAGSLDRKKGKIFRAPNLPDWSGKFFMRDLSRFLKTRVIIENDVALAAIGEASYGVAKGKSIVMYVTVSTGINGALVINKKLASTAFGFEIGHQIIDSKKSLEWYSGGASIEKRFKMPAQKVLRSKQKNTVLDSLAIGLHNTILHWSPEVLVLGGAQMQSISISDIRTRLSKLLTMFPELPQIKKASLGDRSGLYGALELAKKNF